jgi:hypothetical protein
MTLAFFTAASVVVSVSAIDIVTENFRSIMSVEGARRATHGDTRAFFISTRLLVIICAGCVFALDISGQLLLNPACGRIVTVACADWTATLVLVAIVTHPKRASECFAIRPRDITACARVGGALAILATALMEVCVGAVLVVAGNVRRIILELIIWRARVHGAAPFLVSTCIQVQSGACHILAMDHSSHRLVDIAIRQH